MGKSSRWLFLLVIVMVMSCYACASPQQSQAQGQEAIQTQPQSATVFQGSLVQVNTDAKTLTVRNADNKEMQFAYTDTTEIVGAENTAQGLAGKSGERVRITYTSREGVNQATRIEILPYY